jgi:hypothetical protein
MVNTTTGENEGKCVTALEPLGVIDFTYPDGHIEPHKAWLIDCKVSSHLEATAKAPEYMLMRIDGGEFKEDETHVLEPLQVLEL